MSGGALAVGSGIAHPRVIEETIVVGDNVHTHVMSLRGPDAAKAKKCVLIVPGNPGVAQFYKYFMLCMHRDTGLPIYSVSHAGHDVEELNGSTIYSLNDQIQHKIDVIEWLVLRGHQEVYLIGHSIGSYICLKAVQLRPTLPVPRVICLFPFVRYDLSGFINVMYRLMFLSQPALIGVIRLLKSTPQFIQKGVVKLYSGHTVDPDLLLRMLKPRALHNMLAMGEEEFNDVPRKFHYSQLLNLAAAGRVQFLFADNDIWSPMLQFRLLQAVAPSVPVVLAKEDCNHAFCLTARECEIVTQYCSKMLDGPVVSHTSKL